MTLGEGFHIIRVMIVDDELPALKMAESVLKTFNDVFICGAFSDPDELLSCLSVTDVDLVLVDMKMPGMHGLEMAGRIQELKSEVSIVFVTAYDDYAVDAFETEALDYIMKPITVERMKKTLERFNKRYRGQKQNETASDIIVRCFGHFSVEKASGEALKFRTAKTEELLAFLLHHRSNPIAKDRVMEELWYDRDAEKAQSMLYTTIYQLRKDLEAFGLHNVIQHSRKEGGLCRLIWLPHQWDYEEYVEGCRKYKAGNITIEQIKHLVEIYRNGYLAESGYMWASERHSELELSCVELLEEIACYEVQLHRFEFGMLHLKRWADLFPFNERVHFKIIALYLLMSNKEAAKAYCCKVNEMFKVELGENLHIDLEELALNPSIAFIEKTPNSTICEKA